MKKNMFRVFTTSVSGKIKATAIIFLLSAASVKAQDLAYNEPSPKAANVTYLNSTADNMTFQVKLKNTDGEKFSVSVKDKEGTLLFQDTYSDKNFDKKFRLPKTEDNSVTFVIKNLKENTIQTFEVNAKTRMIEEVVVKKIN